MATLGAVAAAVRKLNNGIKGNVANSMSDNAGMIVDMVREQIYSGLSGNGKILTPSYLNDPYFSQPGPWKGRGRAYMAWKKKITPPERSTILTLPARADSTPNLYITGIFHASIKAKPFSDGVTVYTGGFRDGSTIERKYGPNIFGLTDVAKSYFIFRILRPRLEKFYKQCGITK